MRGTRKPYLVLVRYTIRHGRILKSEMAIQNEYDTFAEAEQAARSMDLKKLAENYKLRRDDALVGVRIEMFSKSERGERRLRIYTLKAGSEIWF